MIFLVELAAFTFISKGETRQPDGRVRHSSHLRANVK
jgi:hypothetical protein